MRNAIRWSMLLMMLLGTSALVRADGGLDPYKHFFNDSFGNFQEELAHAREQGKKAVLVFFEMDDCPFCHRMKDTVLNQPEVQKYFREHFLLFPVDIEGDIEITDFEGKERTQKDWAFATNRVRATPVFQFYDLDGKPIARYTGATNSIEEFMWLGEYVASGKYQEKDMSFTKYKRERRGSNG